MLLRLSLPCWVVWALAVPASAAPPRIAYLDKGDVWIVTPGLPRVERETRTGKVEDFRFSADGQYLAYANRLRPGDGRPICAIVITRVSTGSVIKELRPDEGWIDIDKWLGSTLLYHASSGLEVSGFFEFDAARGAGRAIDPGDAHILDTALSRNGSLRAYVDDIGLGPTFQERLHLVNTGTGTESVVVSKRSVMAPAFSWQNDAVAIIEVAGDGKLARDHLWIYRTSDRSVKLLSDEAVVAKSSGDGPAWSPDGTYVSVNFGSKLTVHAVAGNTPPKLLRGASACWSSATSMVMLDANGIQQVDMVTGSQHVLVSSGTRPQCLTVSD